MRVLYSFPFAMGAHGIGNTALNQVLALDQLGCTVTVWCTSLAHPLPKSVNVVQTLKVGGLRVPHRVLGIDRTCRIHDARVANALKRQPESFDVVHTWPLGALSTLMAARSLNLPGYREVPNTHTQNAYAEVSLERRYLGLPPSRGHSHTPSDTRLQREEAEYAEASGLLVPSDHVAETFLKRNFHASKLHRHQYGYDPNLFSPEPHTDSIDRPFTALFAGSCEPRKGLHYALQAWYNSGAANCGRFIICGHFAPDYRALLRPLLDHPSIQYVEFAQRPDKVMRRSDILILPSVEEGSALVTYEAMACGVVPLVSEAAGAPCTHNIDGLIHPTRDLVTLTAQLRMLSNESESLQRLRRAALCSSQDLTWRAAGSRLIEIYREQSIADFCKDSK
jgi:D-inositol-3-phosphate glycosyltransferase